MAKTITAPVTQAKKPVTNTAPKSSAPTAETKAAREHRATRDICAASRKELLITDKIHKGKDNSARPGSLRYNIVDAVQKSKTVGDAVMKEVLGAGKHAEEPYKIKKVDVGFCLGNGFITVTKL